MTTPLRVCIYCGVMPEPVVLVYADGSSVAAEPGSNHAVDCAYYAFPAQPVRVSGPGLTDVRARRR